MVRQITKADPLLNRDSALFVEHNDGIHETYERISELKLKTKARQASLLIVIIKKDITTNQKQRNGFEQRYRCDG